MKKALPHHGWCYVCGHENPHSMGLTWYVDDEKGTLTSEFTLNKAQQGPPDCAHGGASAAILDESMGLIIWAAGLQVAAVNLEINYHRPLPLYQPLFLETRITQKDERKIFSTGEIKLLDGTACVSGRGIYVAAPQLFSDTWLPKME